MPGSSLARRFFLLSALWGALSLAVAGFVIVTVYRASVERAFDERLSVHLKTLVGAFAAQSEAGGGFRAPEGLAEPRFAAADIDRVRQQHISGLSREERDPRTLASRAWYSAAYPEHPYGRSNNGTDRKSTRLNSSLTDISRMPSSA